MNQFQNIDDAVSSIKLHIKNTGCVISRVDEIEQCSDHRKYKIGDIVKVASTFVRVAIPVYADYDECENHYGAYFNDEIDKVNLINVLARIPVGYRFAYYVGFKNIDMYTDSFHESIKIRVARIRFAKHYNEQLVLFDDIMSPSKKEKISFKSSPVEKANCFSCVHGEAAYNEEKKMNIAKCHKGLFPEFTAKTRLCSGFEYDCNW